MRLQEAPRVKLCSSTRPSVGNLRRKDMIFDLRSRLSLAPMKNCR